MTETFPILSNDNKLSPKDFALFSESFADILDRLIPTAGKIRFLGGGEEIVDIPETTGAGNGLQKAFQTLRTEQRLYVVNEQHLLFALHLDGGDSVIVSVSGADPVFLKRVQSDYLLEVTKQAEREFLLLKQARIDVQTGLLNVTNLHSLLERGICEKMQLVLVEIPPKRTTFHHVHRHILHCRNLLCNFVRKNSILHYLGQSTFGLIFPGNLNIDEHKIESSLVAYLKKEGCRKVHIGSSRSPGIIIESEESDSKYRLLHEAWTALRKAEKRGPFSFCEYEHLAFPEKHPLAAPEKGLVAKLSRKWMNLKCFTVALFKGDNDMVNVCESVSSYLDEELWVCSSNEIYVVREGSDHNTMKEWAEEIIAKLRTEKPETSISSGISYHPYKDFKKSELILNCRKAILHGKFFGPGSVVIFDQVSLNISGDIYFSDGDYVKAVKDYKRGILCCADVNLYNSLGVTLAMMGRLREAIGSFQQALKVEKDNFMALYNLGLTWQEKGELFKACRYFEDAYEISTSQHIEKDIVSDLQLQLGIISSETGKSSQAVACLKDRLKGNLKDPRVGVVCYHLGKAYYGLGDNQEAMSMLQKALFYDEFNDRAMSLLGKIYMLENEGLDIALTLCSKSVDLEPDNLLHKLLLAEVLIACNKFSEARIHLGRCLRNKGLRTDAQLLMGSRYETERKFKRAVAWYEKVLNQKGGDKEKTKKARHRLSHCKVLMRRKIR